MVGAGILVVVHGGPTSNTHGAGRRRLVVGASFHSVLVKVGRRTWDKFFYSTYYCSQAAAQLGGRYWEGIYPPLVNALLNSQSPDGSWPVEIGHSDSAFGNVYTTAMAVLSLTPPYQLLPVYQR